jgi:hypothetical protein
LTKALHRIYRLAVVPDTWWQAKVTLDAMRIEWDGGVSRDMSSARIEAKLRGGCR